MEVVSTGQEKDSSAAAEVSSDILKCAEEAQVQASAELVANLRLMLNEPAFSDVVFVCNDGKRVQGSRMLLAGRSEVLKSMFMNGMAESSFSEIELPEISSPMLLSIFEFLYTGTLLDYQPQSWGMACELIIAARFFLLPKLEMITRKFMLAQTSTVAQDLRKAASLLTDAVRFEALCDGTDVNLSELVTILSSDWSDSVYLQSLSEDAFNYLLENSKSNCEDDDKMLFKEYLRFRQVIRWCVYQIALGSRAEENLVNFLVPDEKEALSLCRYPENFGRPESPPEEAGCLRNDWKFFQVDEASRSSAIRLLSLIDCRWIHPALLVKVVEPLEVISSEEILNSFRFHALRRPWIFKTPECDWQHGESYSTLEQGNVIQKTLNKVGFAMMTAATSRSHGVHQWRFIVEKQCTRFVEMGFMYYASGVGAGKPNFGGESLSDQYHARALKLHRVVASANEEGHGGRVDRKEIGSDSTLNVPVDFSYNAFEHTCSISFKGKDFGICWKNLPSEVYYPAVCLGTGSRGRVRAELVSGFNIL